MHVFGAPTLLGSSERPNAHGSGCTCPWRGEAEFSQEPPIGPTLHDFMGRYHIVGWGFHQNSAKAAEPGAAVHRDTLQTCARHAIPREPSLQESSIHTQPIVREGDRHLVLLDKV